MAAAAAHAAVDAPRHTAAARGRAGEGPAGRGRARGCARRRQSHSHRAAPASPRALPAAPPGQGHAYDAPGPLGGRAIRARPPKALLHGLFCATVPSAHLSPASSVVRCGRINVCFRGPPRGAPGRATFSARLASASMTTSRPHFEVGVTGRRNVKSNAAERGGAHGFSGALRQRRARNRAGAGT